MQKQLTYHRRFVLSPWLCVGNSVLNGFLAGLARSFGGNKFSTGMTGNYSMNGSRMLLIFAGLIFLLHSAGAQTFTQVDSATYRQYMDKNWDELIKSGKSGLSKDIDFYYLRIRVGIAYYEKKNYKSAQAHFLKALEFNENDPVASEYLYYSYLLGGQKQQAALLYKEFQPSLQEKIPAPGIKAVEGISAEYLYNQTFTDELISDASTFEGLPIGARIITRDYQNLNAGLYHNMHPGISFRHAYTYLGKSNYYYYDDGVDRFGVDGQKVNQHQYYISPSFTTSEGLVISPSFHFLYISYQVPGLSTGGSGGSGSGPGSGSGIEGSENIVFDTESMNQLLGGLKLLKYKGPFRYGFGFVYSNLNDTKQFTGSGLLTWYPRGNLDMYLGATLYVHRPDADEMELKLIPDLVIGYGIASRVWIEISGSYGEMRNFSQSDGYIVYNGLDWMKSKVLGNIIIPLGKKGSVLYAGARFAQYDNAYISFLTTQSENQYLISYNSLSIFGGLSWKF